MFSKIVLKNPRMFSNLMCCLLYEPWIPWQFKTAASVFNLAVEIVRVMTLNA